MPFVATPSAVNVTKTALKGCFLAAILLAGVAAWPAPATAASSIAPPTVDELVEQFEQVVFGSEFADTKASTMVRKWVQPLRITIRAFGEKVIKKEDGNEERELKQTRVKRRHSDFIQDHLDTLVGLTGLKTEDIKQTAGNENFSINFVPPHQMANPHLAKVNQKLLRKLASQGGCYFLSWADPKSGFILKATIVVNVKRVINRIKHCILEEMVQSMGFPNDVNSRWSSVFSNREKVTQLSRSDSILIKTLYDPRMKPGLPRADAVKLARIIIAELDRTMP